MIIDCIADLHGYCPKLEGGDLLIVAGDLTACDQPWEYINFGVWINRQKYKKKIVISGNHDNIAQTASPFIDPQTNEWEYLCDSGTEFEGLKIWGSPWTLKFEGMNPKCMAFACDTEEELAEKWALIPDDIDILVTHGPQYGKFDSVDREDREERVGSTSLTKWIANHVDTVKLHVCGHIHEGYGVWDMRKAQEELNSPKTPIFVNCSHVNEHYEPVNKPIRVIL